MYAVCTQTRASRRTYGHDETCVYSFLGVFGERQQAHKNCRSKGGLTVQDNSTPSILGISYRRMASTVPETRRRGGGETQCHHGKRLKNVWRSQCGGVVVEGRQNCALHVGKCIGSDGPSAAAMFKATCFLVVLEGRK